MTPTTYSCFTPGTCSLWRSCLAPCQILSHSLLATLKPLIRKLRGIPLATQAWIFHTPRACFTSSPPTRRLLLIYGIPTEQVKRTVAEQALPTRLRNLLLGSPRGHGSRAEGQRADTQPAWSTSMPRSTGQAASCHSWSRSRDRRLKGPGGGSARGLRVEPRYKTRRQ